MKKVNDFWVDDNNNKWHYKAYNKEMAEQLANTLIDCYDCVDCAHCHNCYNCKNCNYCSHCNGCQNCNSCYHCTDCMYCNDCATSRNISNCEHCVKSKDCDQCIHCRVCTLCDRCNNCYRCYGVADGSDLSNQKVLSPKVAEIKEVHELKEPEDSNKLLSFSDAMQYQFKEHIPVNRLIGRLRNVFDEIAKMTGCNLDFVHANEKDQTISSTTDCKVIAAQAVTDLIKTGYTILNSASSMQKIKYDSNIVVIFKDNMMTVIVFNTIADAAYYAKDFIDKLCIGESNEHLLNKHTANRDEVLLGVTTDVEREVYNFVYKHLGRTMSPLMFNVEYQYSYATIRFETLPDKLFQDCKDEGFNIINNGVIYTNHRLAVIHINNDSIHARMFKNKDYLDKYLSVHYPNLNRVNLDTRLNPKNILKYKFRDDDIFIIRSICNAVHATTYTEGTDKNDNPRLAVIPVGEVTESIIRTLDTLRYNFYYNNNITNRGSNVSIVVRKTELAVYIFDAKDQALSFIQSIKFNPLD